MAGVDLLTDCKTCDVNADGSVENARMAGESRQIPIVLVASGTATAASASYHRMAAACRQSFPEHPVHLAFSSRAIRKRIQARGEAADNSPRAVLEALLRAGHRSAVVQSLHLICGIEFHHLVWEAARSSLAVHLGLPLLAHPEDFETVVDWIADVLPAEAGDGLVLVGHGTTHPAWMAYAVLEKKIADRFGDKVLLGQVKGDPLPSVVATRLAAAGCRRVYLRPFMLVAGAHFMRDVAGGGPQAWRSRLEKRGLAVVPEGEGLGAHPAAMAIVNRHIKAALESPPLNLD